jgi:hypothetical protein
VALPPHASKGRGLRATTCDEIIAEWQTHTPDSEEQEHDTMPISQEHQPTLDSVAPRFLVRDMEQALAFYAQLGFVTTYHDEGFAIIERDKIALQFNVSDPSQEPPQRGCKVCYIAVTDIEALYQQYLPTGALRSPIQATS